MVFFMFVSFGVAKGKLSGDLRVVQKEENSL